MKIKINKQIGNTAFQFEIEKTKDKDTLFLAGSLAMMPSQCKLCKSKNVSLSGNKAQEYTFVKVICQDCNANSQMGEFKDGSGFYWKNWEKYQPVRESISKTEEDDIPVVDDDIQVKDIPFK